MRKQQIRLMVLLICVHFGAIAQNRNFQYKRKLSGVTTNWHSLQIPNQVFSKSKNGLMDLRILGIKGRDTIEVPYILEQSANQITEKENPFKIINQSSNQEGYYYTFQTNHPTTINQLKLSFKEANFDWKIDLAGSQDNISWFNILKNYRILSIKNSSTDYQFTQLEFPESKFGYFRLLIKSSEQPTLAAAKISKIDTLIGITRLISLKSYQLKNDKKNKQTIINIDLNEPTPVSYLKLNVESELDFYRSIKVESAVDSFKTDKGIQYNYVDLFDGTLSSLEATDFNFGSTLASHVRITIRNNDNQPLRITRIELKGPVYELIGRFEKLDYNYALFYGNKESEIPSYELKNFEQKIPIGVAAISIGKEERNPAFIEANVAPPLFENKIWLWCIMGLIISLLGYFAYKMLRH